MTGRAGPAKLVLASASPRRRDLLEQIGATPDIISPCDINEDERPGELPGPLALRLAREKLSAAIHPDCFVLASDTVVAVGRRVLPKAESREQAKDCLQLMSGRNHRVYTAIAARAPDGREVDRLVETRIAFKRLSTDELEAYLDSEEWSGKAGGYGIQGRAGAFIENLIGSYTGVVGLPVYETRQLLIGLGYRF